MSHFVILLGGPVTVTARLRAQIAGARAVAADSGMRHAASLGLAPELWAGDFDSAGDDLEARYTHVPRLRFPAEKDATDGEIALRAALERGADRLTLVGALGGQADHVLGHFALALGLAREGMRVDLTSGTEEARPLIAGEIRIDLPAESRLSVIGFSDLAGLDLEGVKWPLAGRNVPLGSSLTLSNVSTGPVTIRLARGSGMIIAYPQA